ncbi:DUF4304 domain-containing protein [Paenibacillus alba]|uniref:DUF4304 domain-containing protein n=1 Tax=Paenibacillus alba TaxID=1197127 RepID=UPI0015662361|nr:DUF4304 domain-containing protein [Paenibacillus alba]NQX65651.1 DUF4304 domain-containing protein [Paenibacillus alba]
MKMQDVLKQIVKETIAPLFKVEGFKKQGNNFAYVCSDFSATVNIQSSKWNTEDEVEFFFNTGIYIDKLFGTVHLYPKPSFPMEIDSVLRIRGTELTKKYDKFCYKHQTVRKAGDYTSNLNFTTKDGNDGTMYPETIPPILLRASCLTEYEV